MPLHKLSQKSFVSGQYDRTAQNQESVSSGGIVAAGLSYAKNVVSSDRGEVRKRLGTKFLKQLDSASVIVPFRMPDDDDAVLLCNNNQIAGYQYNNDGSFSEFMVASGVAPTIPHDSGWDNSNVNGDYTVTCSSDSQASTWGKGFNSDSWRQNRPYTPRFPFGTEYNVGNVSSSVNVPAWVVIESTSPQILGQLTFCWLLTCNGDHRGHYKGWLNPVLQYSDDGNDWATIQTGVYKTDSTGISGVSYSNNLFHIFDSSATENRVQCIIENIDHLIPHKYWRIYFKDRIINNAYYNAETFTFFCYDIKYVSATQSAYTDTFDIQNLKDIKYAQNEQTMFIASKGNKPIKIRYQNGNFTQTTFTAVDTYGTPACVEYFQNRLWFGGFSTMPNGVVASKFGAYETFTPSSPVQVDDAMELKCNQLQSQITNLKGGQKVLYCFSQDGISNIDGGSNGYNATSVQNIEFILKNRMPAGNATPAFKDDVMLYSSSDGTKLYGVDFDLLVNRFQVNDLAKYAKDITKAKITELHYVNNESKLVYGLTETGKMFALLYEKGQYQGFFPQEVGTEVYDIASIKVGRDYKLLMVVFRDGNWYLEEKLDCGKYIDTSTPGLTDEEKKWATYDNLENNIALDCYQTYDESFNAILNTNININIDIMKNVYSQPGALQSNGEITTEGLCDYKKVEDDSVVQAQKVDVYRVTDFMPVVPGGVYIMNDAVNQEYYQTTIKLDGYDANYNYVGPVLQDISVLKSEAINGHRATFTLTMPSNVAFVRCQYFHLDTPSLVGKSANNHYLVSNVNLSNYIGKSLMLTNDNEKDFSTIVLDTNNGWTFVDGVLGNHNWTTIAYGNSKVVAIGLAGYVSTSENGEDWTTPVSNTNLLGHEWDSVVYANNKFVALSVDGYISTSIDGEIWSVADEKTNLGNRTWTSLAYGNSLFVAISQLGYVSTSADGENWTPSVRYDELTGVLWDKIIYGNSKFVASGAGGHIAVTENGINWNVASYSNLSYTGWVGLVYDGVRFVLLNSQELYSFSDDGLAWSGVYWSVGGELSAIDFAYGNNKYYAIKRNGDVGIAYNLEIGYTLESQRGTQTVFTKVYPEFTQFAPNLPQVASVGVISEGRYFNATHPDTNGLIYLPAPCHKVIYGVNYESLAILKIQAPYESLKQVAQVDVSVIDTTHLEVGTDFSDTQYIEKIDDSSYYDLTRITMNDTYRVVVSDTPEMTKNVILRSNKGVPFTVIAVDMYVNYSNLGGD